MTKARTAIACPREPIGLRLAESAAFVGMSPTLFKRLVEEGAMPSPREFRGSQIWDADELIQAFRSRPHKVDLRPGAPSMHDEHMPDDPWDRVKA